MDPETPGFVRGGGNHAPGPQAADNDRPPRQIRVVQNLDCGVEGVHIHVNYAPDRHGAYSCLSLKYITSDSVLLIE
jgi:hypothetical protein